MLCMCCLKVHSPLKPSHSSIALLCFMGGAKGSYLISQQHSRLLLPPLCCAVDTVCARMLMTTQEPSFPPFLWSYFLGGPSLTIHNPLSSIANLPSTESTLSEMRSLGGAFQKSKGTEMTRDRSISGCGHEFCIMIDVLLA